CSRAALYCSHCALLFFSFFVASSPPLIYPLSLHDALPISPHVACRWRVRCRRSPPAPRCPAAQKPVMPWAEPFAGSPVPSTPDQDRKSTRLNSSHVKISYAVFCLKKKIKITETHAQIIESL